MTTRAQSGPSGSTVKRYLPPTFVLTCVAQLIYLAFIRLAGLGLDPPTWLSSSSGIFSDEGMYAADARCMAVFGHWAPGDFHGAIITPILYEIQLTAFRLFGPDLVVARAISVVFGLLTIVVLWLAMNRAYGARTATCAAVMLGYSLPFVLYNRLALMETPVAFFLTASFAAMTMAWSTDTVTRNRWNVAAGLLFAVAVAVKALAWLALPAFIAAGMRSSRRDTIVFVGTVALAAALYGVTVLRPYAETLHRMNAYYLEHQYLPHSLVGLAANIKRAIGIGAGDSILKCLLIQSNVAFVAALAAIAGMWRRRSQADLALGLWVMVPLVAFALMSYSPSRYYVLVLPPLSAMAALKLVSMPNKALVVAIVSYVLCSAIGLILALSPANQTVSTGSKSLTRMVQSGTVAGQFAPALTFGSANRPLYVQPGLANDERPIERFRVGTVLVTRSPYWDTWWRTRYPSIITPDHLIGTINVARKYNIDVYRVH